MYRYIERERGWYLGMLLLGVQCFTVLMHGPGMSDVDAMSMCSATGRCDADAIAPADYMRCDVDMISAHRVCTAVAMRCRCVMSAMCCRCAAMSMRCQCDVDTISAEMVPIVNDSTLAEYANSCDSS